jgi:FMN phosphatase YigB (HAD superfamily)
MADLLPAETKIRALIQASSCVSFDFFDTLVRRRGLFFPKDLFAVVESQAGAKLGRSVAGFAKLREEAESGARAEAVRGGRVETTLAEIYVVLAKRLGLSQDEQSVLMTLELDCERSVLEKDEAAASLYDFALAAGKTVAITTDTYLDEGFIKETCSRLGYSQARLFVSSRYAKVKHDGTLFDVLIEQVGVPAAQILHIGDSTLSDVSAASAKGIRVWNFLNLRQVFQKRLHIPSTSSGSVAASRILCEINSGMTAKSDDPNAGAGRRIALSFAFLLLGFTMWLVQQVRETSAKRIYFVAREGLLLKRCFDFLAELHGQRFDTRYLIASRTSLYPSLIFSSRETALAIFGKSWSKTTVSQAIKRLSLTYEDVSRPLRAYGFNSASDRLQHGSHDAFQRFMLDHWPQIEQANRQKNADIISYLTQERFLDEDEAVIVDLGWHLTLQRSLASLSEMLSIRRAIRGRYLGIFRVNQYDGEGDAAGYLATYGAPQNLTDLLRAGPSLLETLHGAHHGTVLGYAPSPAGSVEPVFEINEAESSQHAAVVAPIQAAAVEYFERWAALLKDGHKGAIPPDLCAKIGLSIVNHPTASDAELLGGILHAQDFSGGMKSITGVAEWNLARIQGDLLPDGTVPMWRAGFEVLRTAQRALPNSIERGSTD